MRLQAEESTKDTGKMVEGGARGDFTPLSPLLFMYIFPNSSTIN